MFDQVIERLATVKEDPGDYISPDDGLLYCGRCHTPKTVLLVCLELAGTDEPRLFPIACQCQEQAAEEERQKVAAAEFSATMRGRWDRCGFHDSGLLRHKFSADDGGQQQITDTLKRYVSKWDDMRRNNVGILLYGPVGTGKSFLASCLCNAVLERQMSVCATSFSRILNIMQSSPDRQAVLDRLEGFQLAFIDDPGSERDTPYAIEQIFSVIDSRYRIKKPVLITTNLTLKQMESPENLAYSRIFDRVLEMCPVRLAVTGKSRRVGLAEERRKLARELLLIPGGTDGR